MVLGGYGVRARTQCFGGLGLHAKSFHLSLDVPPSHFGDEFGLGVLRGGGGEGLVLDGTERRRGG